MIPHHFVVGYVPPAGAFPPGPVPPGFAFPQSPRQAYYAPAPIYSVAPSMPWPGVSAVPYAPPMIRRRRPRTSSATEATETQSPTNLAPAAAVSGEDRPVGVVGPMPRETAASPTLTVPQASAPPLISFFSHMVTPAPTPAESRTPTPVNVSTPVISVEVQAPHVSVASGSSGTHPFPPLGRPSSEYDLVRVVSDVLVLRVGEIPVESERRDPQRHADPAQLIETQNYIHSLPPLPPRPRLPFAGRDVAGNEDRLLQFPTVSSAGNSSSIHRENNSARDTVSSTGDIASLDREQFPIVSGLLNSNPVVELPLSELANDVLNDPRVAEALEARVEAGVHVPERAPEPDRPIELISEYSSPKSPHCLLFDGFEMIFTD
ncbi:hypothetical protein QAD02_008441 [Eretmocerus hayati]|uniref:Uncharacterized protein n=1 Tax=Eretmocerus hayati TaxID=131215 RepID=A0ACC2N6U3_9HYME|nr:hypothetical protein QAD02_008441 [Eretmocerus hayati]